VRFVFHVDSEAVGELAAIVGEDGMDRIREVGEEPGEEAGGSFRVALWMDFHIDIAGRAIDSDEGVALPPLQGRQVFEIDVNEADSRLFEDADRRLVGLGPLVEAVASEAAMNGAARELGVEAAMHHLDDVVERQRKPGPQFANQRLLHRGKADCQALGSMGTIGDRVAAAPAPNGGLADAQFGCQFRDWPTAALDVSPGLRGRGGVGV
jgi:hypothetical protein